MAYELPEGPAHFDAAAHGGEVLDLPATMSHSKKPRRVYVASTPFRSTLQLDVPHDSFLWDNPAFPYT